MWNMFCRAHASQLDKLMQLWSSVHQLLTYGLIPLLKSFTITKSKHRWQEELGFFPLVFGKICSLPVLKHTLRLWLVHAHYVPFSINMHVVDWVIIGE